MTEDSPAPPGSATWREDRARRLVAFGRGSALPSGGFGWLDSDGTVDPAKPRPLFLTARMTYSFSLAWLQWRQPDDLRLASAGVRSLLDEYRDRDHGGWYSSLDARGTVDDPSKANYAHAHVLLASSTALAAGVPDAGDALDLAAASIDEHFWAEDEGAAVETWDAAFADLEPYRGANSNMHSLEAYLAAGDVTGDPKWRARGLAIAEKIINSHARAQDWRIPEHYDASWQPVLDFNRDRPDDQFRPFGTTPGHSFEWSRLLVTLDAAAEGSPGWLMEAAVGLFDAAVAHGWAADGSPGFVYTLDFDDRPIVKQRLHWVVCEAVLAADFLHRRTGDERYARLADDWWQHIDAHFIDAANGSWHQELDPRLRPSTTIWSGRPDVYHSYQALLLPSLPLTPAAAVTIASGADRGA